MLVLTGPSRAIPRAVTAGPCEQHFKASLQNTQTLRQTQVHPRHQLFVSHCVPHVRRRHAAWEIPSAAPRRWRLSLRARCRKRLTHDRDRPRLQFRPGTIRSRRGYQRRNEVCLRSARRRREDYGAMVTRLRAPPPPPSDAPMLTMVLRSDSCKHWLHMKCLGYGSRRNLPKVFICSYCVQVTRQARRRTRM